MGDPVTMMLIAQSANGIMQGIAANNAGKANQKIANANAGMSRRQADAAKTQSAFNARQIQGEGTRLLSTSTQSVLAKGNVEIAGSPLVALGDAAAAIKMKELTEIYGGNVKAHQLEEEARMFEYRGRIARQQGKTQRNMSFLGSAMSMGGAAYAGGAFTTAPPFATGSYPVVGPFSMNSPNI